MVCTEWKFWVVTDYGKVPNDLYAYGIVNINEYLNADDLVHIVNETLTKNEEVKILNMTKNSTYDYQQNFVDIKYDSDNISDIEVEESVNYSRLSIINVNSMAKGKEK